MTLDLCDSTLVADVTLFACVVVEPVLPKPAPAVSVAAVERFVTTFAGALLAADRRFSTRELALAAEGEAVGASTSVVTKTLQRLKPTSWARRGRRSAVQIPTPIEIADAAPAGASKRPLSISSLLCFDFPAIVARRRDGIFMP